MLTGAEVVRQAAAVRGHGGQGVTARGQAGGGEGVGRIAHGAEQALTVGVEGDAGQGVILRGGIGDQASRWRWPCRLAPLVGAVKTTDGGGLVTG